MSILFAAPIEQHPPHLAFTPAVTHVVGNDAAIGYPHSNLFDYDPTRVFKAAGLLTEFNVDFGSQREFDVVSLPYSSLSYKATWKLQVSNDGVNWTTLFSGLPFSSHLTSVPVSWASEFTDPRRPILNRNKSFWHGAVQKARYLNVRLSGDAVLDASQTHGRLFIGKAFKPSTGWQYGSSFSFTDSGIKDRTDRGALVLQGGESRVTASVKMEFLNKAEMYDYVYELNYWRGSCREVLACLDLEDVARLQKNVIYGTLSEGRQISIDSFDTHSQTWILESIM